MAYKSVRRAVAIPRLWELAFSGVPTMSALRTIRSEGIGYRTQVYLRDYARIKQHVRYLAEVGPLAPDETPARSLIPEVRLTRDKKYMSIVRVESEHPITREPQENYITMYHDSLLTQGQIQEQASTIFNPEQYEIGMFSEQFFPVVTYHHQGKTW